MSLYVVNPKSAPSYFVRRARIYEPGPQSALDAVFSRQAEMFCLCLGAPGAPLFTALGPKGRHPRRMDGTAELHASGCPHSDQPNLSSALCAPPGSFSQSDGHFVVNLDALFPPRPDGSGSGGGAWDAPRGDAMLSLAWALIQLAGLNVIHREAKPNDPFRHLLDCAAEVRVKSGSTLTRLDSILLVPYYGERLQREVVESNREKLCRAHAAKQSVLLASLLPSPNGNGSGLADVSLKPIFGPTATIWRKDLARALTKYRAAKMRWAGGGQVLVVALAEASAKADTPSSLFAKITKVALMPVTQWLTPLPTAQAERSFDDAMRNGELFVSAPEQDELLGPGSPAQTPRNRRRTSVDGVSGSERAAGDTDSGAAHREAAQPSEP